MESKSICLCRFVSKPPTVKNPPGNESKCLWKIEIYEIKYCRINIKIKCSFLSRTECFRTGKWDSYPRDLDKACIYLYQADGGR